jgi:exodeoxyribonuclease VII small subunit
MHHLNPAFDMPKASAPTPSTASAVDQKPPESYEAAMEELEHLVNRLESGDMALDQLLGGYQRGAFLLQFCRDQLGAVEEQIKVLDASVLKPWKPT